MVTPAADANTPLYLTGMDDVEQSIARAFEATMQHLVQTDLEALERTYQAFASNLDDILAKFMRKRNATSSFPCRLPDELWSAIWEDSALSLSDWISFSHVCHAWRHLALLSPRLWRDISFTTRAPPECSCQACLDNETSRLELQFARLDALLPRSSPLPFNFRISCPDNDQLVSSSLILRIARTLELHIHRLARMHAEFDDPTKLCSFLGSLETLPALRVLVADTTYGSTVDQRVSLPISRERMPQLRKLNLSHWDFDYELFPLTGPMVSVKELSYTFTCADDLLRLLGSFPRLEIVTLCPIDGDLAADFNSALDVSEIRRLAAKVQDISLIDVSDVQEALFVDMFRSPGREAMTIDFLDHPHPASLSSLADLREAESDGRVELVVTCIGASSVLMTAQTLDGRRRRSRQFRFPYHRHDDSNDVQVLNRVFSRIWEFFPLSSVDTLIVDAETWAALPSSPPSTRMKALRVVLRDEERYPFPWTGPPPARFPALQRMTVSSAGPWRSEIAAESLAQFVMSLDPEGKRLTVVLQDGVSIVGQDDELRAMCGLWSDR